MGSGVESRPNRDIRALKQHKLVMPVKSQDRSAGQQDSQQGEKGTKQGCDPAGQGGNREEEGDGEGENLSQQESKAWWWMPVNPALSKSEVSTGLSQH